MNFSQAREMTPYIDTNSDRQVGSVCKSGFLYLGFELDANGKSILREWERHVPLIVQQALYFDEEMPEMPCVYILSSGGPNVDGDRYEQNFVLRRGAIAFISTGAATKLAEMRYNYSSLTQHITLDDDAYLEYMPEPIIPCRHTRFIADTDISIADSATLFYSEIYLGGRKYYGAGETFAYDILSVCAHARRPDGVELFREKFVIRPDVYSPRKLGVMAGYDVFANVIVLTPKEHADAIYDLTQAYIDRNADLAVGITHLPYDSGLLLKVLGSSTESVKRIVREFCSTVRRQIKHKPLPKEFPWR